MAPTKRVPPDAELAALVNEDWVSLRQFIKVAGITYPTGIRWCNEGRILARRAGTQWQITVTELKRYLRYGTREPQTRFQFPSQKREAEKRKLRRQALKDQGNT